MTTTNPSPGRQYSYNQKFCPNCEWVGVSAKDCPLCKEHRLIPIRQAIATGRVLPGPVSSFMLYVKLGFWAIVLISIAVILAPSVCGGH